jgi:hypothetical protein
LQLGVGVLSLEMMPAIKVSEFVYLIGKELALKALNLMQKELVVI